MELKWLAICFAAIMIVLTVSESIVSIEEEKTKQLQLQIELLELRQEG